MESLPEEILFQIMCYLDCNNLLVVLHVNKTMNCLANDESFWKKISSPIYDIDHKKNVIKYRRYYIFYSLEPYYFLEKEEAFAYLFASYIMTILGLVLTSSFDNIKLWFPNWKKVNGDEKKRLLDENIITYKDREDFAKMFPDKKIGIIQTLYNNSRDEFWINTDEVISCKIIEFMDNHITRYVVIDETPKTWLSDGAPLI